ncbi:MAG: 3-hydroxybutyryl-CoA dehydrogenase [Proteobacteria bacterium]|nr:3-hydroxybutyryl-CoA dehydrogenase [Pseudomonadota bacterium]
MTIKTVGVIGAGTMGNGIAQVFAASGFQVIMQDISEEGVNRGVATIGSSLDRLIKSEKISEAEKTSTLERITATTDLGSMANADLVVEAASENFEIKTSVFRDLDKICKPETILASNTSSISLTKIAATTERADRVIGMHFMNPVPLMKLIEVIRALQTSDETCAVIEGLAEKLGKTALLANDSPGFVANRILVPMINEAIFTLHEGIATAEAIDEIMKLGMNHPIGPLALADLVGLDVLLSIMRVLQNEMGDPKFRPCPLLIKMVDAGYLGRKAGRGFYEY